MQSEKIAIGNPVDNWWNATRPQIQICIEMVSQYPPVADSELACQGIQALQAIQEAIYMQAYPEQAKEIRGFLLDTLNHLRLSLKFLAEKNRAQADACHNIAYNRYMMVCYLLLHRGIYEPAPLGLY